jgi:peptidoglycan/LPS O-acetylase OafA/YrhL
MRLAQLDGVRTVAVLLVIFLQHFMGERTGWVGVDIFFALSGFLITGILTRSGGARHYWRTFYIKKRAIDLPLALLVAWISFRLLESPVLRWVHRLTRGDEPARAHRFA